VFREPEANGRVKVEVTEEPTRKTGVWGTQNPRQVHFK
jgi:hypothetical protein